MIKTEFDNPQFFLNRELSWLEFNNRVLEEANDRNNPLLERAMFLSIVSSNLDEFFMKRVGYLKDQVNAGINQKDCAGLTPKQQLKDISIRTKELTRDKYKCYNNSILPELKRNGINLIKQLSKTQETFLDDYFTNVIYPVLTPMAVDSSRPFPLILNKSLNLAVLIKKKHSDEKLTFATVQVPSVLPRLVKLPGKGDQIKHFIFLEEVISMYINQLFMGYDIICIHPYRITRNADLGLDEEEADDLLKQIEESLKKRKWGQAVRLEIDKRADQRLVRFLKEALEIQEEDIYRINGPLDLTFLKSIYNISGYDYLKYPEYRSQTPRSLLGEEDIFEAIKRKDVLLHHPYESFEPVIGFVAKAAKDPDVLAIKQTLYRVSGDSPIVKALSAAAERGKQVTVLVELKARFDEENNIRWAKRLEKAGCHVIYGLVGLKTHCKVTLVVRKENTGIKRYVHLGTGNYNDITARQYIDVGIFTCNEYFGADASALFNMLSGYSQPPQWYKMTIAPISLRERFLELIQRETKHALKEKKARIIAKMNSLVDSEVIKALYKASCAGVEIDLIVRGICCLRTDIPGVSENISVRSIVGRFLEHSRIYYFYNDGKEEVFFSSADWMPRNLDRRVEVLFPIEDEEVKARALRILQIQLKDTAKARLLKADGKYEKIKAGDYYMNSQDYFCKRARKWVKEYLKDSSSSFTPITSMEKFRSKNSKRKRGIIK